MTSTGTRLAGAAAAAAFALTFTAHTRAGRLDQQEIRVETRSTTGPISIGGLPGGDNAAPMEQGTALIVGQAVEANSTRPIGGALVTLGLPGARPLRVLADGEGRFAFRGLPKGRFNITRRSRATSKARTGGCGQPDSRCRWSWRTASACRT